MFFGSSDLEEGILCLSWARSLTLSGTKIVTDGIHQDENQGYLLGEGRVGATRHICVCDKAIASNR